MTTTFDPPVAPPAPPPKRAWYKRPGVLAVAVVAAVVIVAGSVGSAASSRTSSQVRQDIDAGVAKAHALTPAEAAARVDDAGGSTAVAAARLMWTPAIGEQVCAANHIGYAGAEQAFADGYTKDDDSPAHHLEAAEFYGELSSLSGCPA